MLSGRDLMAGAQTGTGKTAAFALPILQRFAPLASTSTSPARHPVRALVLTPTRELAVQVDESFRDYGKNLPLRSTVVYGGVDMNAQIEQLRKGVEILVATPGRLLDHVQNKTVMFNQVSVLVLDEADRMLDMGFLPDIKRIIALLPKERQNLLFSATFPDEIRTLAQDAAAQPGRGAGRGAQRRRRFGHARDAPGGAREEARAAFLPDPDARPEAGAGVLRHAHRRQPPRAPAAQGPHPRRRDPRRQDAGRARSRARRLQVGQDQRAGGDRRRLARPRHRGPAAGDQLRRAALARGLRAPHRPHRPRRPDRRGDLAGRAAGPRGDRGDRAPDQEAHRARAGAELRGQRRERRRADGRCAETRPGKRQRERPRARPRARPGSWPTTAFDSRRSLRSDLLGALRARQRAQVRTAAKPEPQQPSSKRRQPQVAALLGGLKRARRSARRPPRYTRR